MTRIPADARDFTDEADLTLSRGQAIRPLSALPLRYLRAGAITPNRSCASASSTSAAANALPDPVPEPVKEERYARLMELTERISAEKLAAKVGKTLPVIVDEVGEPDEDGDIGATARGQADAPEIDGQVFLRTVPASLQPGDFAEARIEDADAHDLFGVIAPALK